MKLRSLLRDHLFAWCLTMAAVPAIGQTVYENGPINGNNDAWTLNFGFVVSDSFTVSSGISTITGLSFGAWLFPGDTLTSAEVSMTSGPDGGTTYFEQVISFSASGCVMNQFGFNVCTEAGTFNGPTLANGMYWLNVQNAVIPSGDPVYWDENTGVGCHSPGCPSQAYFYPEGTVPSESFTLLGTTASTGSVPEPSGLLLFTSAFFGLAAMLRRKLF